MRFSSFTSIVLGSNFIGIGVGIIIGYHFLSKDFSEFWLYLSVPILTLGALLMMYGALNNKN